MSLLPADDYFFREPPERSCSRCHEPSDWLDGESGRCHVCLQLPDCCDGHVYTEDDERDGVEVRLYVCNHGTHSVAMGLAI